MSMRGTACTDIVGLLNGRVSELEQQLAEAQAKVKALKEECHHHKTSNETLKWINSDLTAQLEAAKVQSADHNEVVRHMVDRFLGWKLPKDFYPDCGISFERTVRVMEGEKQREELGEHWWPSGTNLFHAEQAKAMIEFMLEGLPAAKVQGEPEKENHKESERIMVATQGMHGPEEIIDGTLQDRVQPWMLACFGPEIAADKLERGDRFIEEALELLQSGDYPKERVYALVEYVYGRPKGEPLQEAGGVMITLAAYCLAHGLNMHEAGEAELARIWTKVEQIREKQKAKPTGSALPIPAPSTEKVSQEPDPQLCKFYQVDSYHALVEAMEKHILKLQERVVSAEKPFSFMPQRVREG